jgi:hypothetical protein
MSQVHRLKPLMIVEFRFWTLRFKLDIFRTFSPVLTAAVQTKLLLLKVNFGEVLEVL